MKKDEKFDIIKFLIVLGIGMMILSMFCRCTTTKVVPITEYRDRYINKTDTFMLTDSVWLHDSVSVFVRGDTIYILTGGDIKTGINLCIKTQQTP